MTATSSPGTPGSSHPTRPTAERDDLVAVGLAGLAPFPVAAVLGALPAGPATTVASVGAMAAIVVLAAWRGGRRAGLAAAVVAGLSFDFFHTTPIHLLRVDAIDLATLALLLALGLLAAGGRPATPHDRRP